MILMADFVDILYQGLSFHLGVFVKGLEGLYFRGGPFLYLHSARHSLQTSVIQRTNTRNRPRYTEIDLQPITSDKYVFI